MMKLFRSKGVSQLFIMELWLRQMNHPSMFFRSILSEAPHKTNVSKGLSLMGTGHLLGKIDKTDSPSPLWQKQW